MDLKAPRVPSQGSPQEPCVYCGGVRGQTQPLTNIPTFIEGVVSWFPWSGTPPFCTNLAITGKRVGEDSLLTMLHDLIFTMLQLLLLQFKEGPCLLPGQGNGAALEYFTTQTIPCTCFSLEASGHTHFRDNAVGMDKHSRGWSLSLSNLLRIAGSLHVVPYLSSLQISAVLVDGLIELPREC